MDPNGDVAEAKGLVGESELVDVENGLAHGSGDDGSFADHVGRGAIVDCERMLAKSASSSIVPVPCIVRWRKGGG